jgi:hypothetical protein
MAALLGKLINKQGLTGPWIDDSTWVDSIRPPAAPSLGVGALRPSPPEPEPPQVTMAGAPLGKTQQPGLRDMLPNPQSSRLLGRVAAPNADEENALRQDIGKLTPKPYNYGEHGVGRNALHVLGKIGNYAGNALIPNIMAIEPGTDLNRQISLRSKRDRLSDLQKLDLDEARTAAQTEEASARTEVLRDPRKALDPSKTVQTDDGVFQLNPATGRYDQRVGDRVTKPNTIEEQAYEYAISQGKNPLDAQVTNL